LLGEDRRGSGPSVADGFLDPLADLCVDVLQYSEARSRIGIHSAEQMTGYRNTNRS
jgi:hypothetical protein